MRRRPATATGSNARFPGLYQAVYEGVIPFGAAIRPSVSPSSRFHRIPAPTKAYRRTFRSDRNAPINSAHCCSEYPTRKTYRYRAYSCRTLSVISAVAATGTRSTVRCAAATSITPTVSSERYAPTRAETFSRETSRSASAFATSTRPCVSPTTIVTRCPKTPPSALACSTARFAACTNEVPPAAYGPDRGASTPIFSASGCAAATQGAAGKTDEKK